MIAVLFACAPPVLELEATRDASGARVEATLPLDRVEIRDAEGGLVVARQVVPALAEVTLRAPLAPGSYAVHANAGAQRVTSAFRVPDPGPFSVHLEAPLGQDALPVDGVVDVPAGSSVRVGLVLTGHAQTPIEWTLGGQTGRQDLVPGERLVLTADLADAPLVAVVRSGSVQRDFVVTPRSVDPALLRERLDLTAIALPALADGTRDATLPVGRVDLPAPWWGAVLDRLRLGFRPRDDQAPRTWVAATLRNDGAHPLNAVVSAEVTVDGLPHPAFRPRLRDATDLQTVRRLVRVPPGESVSAALPVYLDRRAVTGPIAAQVELKVRPLGSAAVLHERSTPLIVRRGTPWASALFIAGVLGMVLGWAGIAVGLRRWLARSTGELTTVAVFGSLSFTVGAASQLLGLGLSSVLGPFAPFLLGIADDALRMCLLATLLALVPRVGVFALATLVGWLMRALALGAVHPVDALYLGNTVLLTESALWIVGITREKDWLDNGLAGVRLVGGLAVPNAVGTALALAVSVVLYRLYYAGWYVGATVLVPGFLYASIGCVVALPFARSLRRVG